MHSLFPVQFILCFRRSDNKARRSDGGERVKSYAGKTTGKKGGETCLPSFFNFSPALYYLNAWKRLNRPPPPSPPPKKTTTTQNYRKKSRGFEDRTFKQFILPHLKQQRVFLRESDWPSVTHPQFVRFWVFQSRTLRLLRLHCVQHRRCRKKK